MSQRKSNTRSAHSIKVTLRRGAYTFFYGAASPFSQWHSAPFHIDGIPYSFTEEWMMSNKARKFRDFSTLAAIMATPDPSEQKKLGRTV